MKNIFSNIWTWSCYSEEKGMNFNGYYIEKANEKVVIDPPLLSTDDLDFLRKKGVTDILLTNRDHIRESANILGWSKAKMWAPAADAADMSSVPVDHWFKDGDILPGSLKVVSLNDQKSLGESMLYLEQSGGIMILGDALIGKPAGQLNLLPAEKYVDFQKAKSGLRRLLNYAFEVVLVGDGESILHDGKRIMEAAL